MPQLVIPEYITGRVRGGLFMPQLLILEYITGRVRGGLFMPQLLIPGGSWRINFYPKVQKIKYFFYECHCILV